MKVFSIQVADGRKGQDGEPSIGPVYRNIMNSRALLTPDHNINTSWDIFRATVDRCPDNRMLGWRKVIDGKVGPYVWKTYKQVFQEVLHIGSALRESGAEPGARVGIYGSNCPQWIVAMEACNAHTLICVPLYDTLGPKAVDYIIEHAEVDFVFIQENKVNQLLKSDCKSVRRIKSLVSFTSLTKEQKINASRQGMNLYSWKEFLQMGKDHPVEVSVPRPFNICTIMYTSGTSGDPKGVVLTHECTTLFIKGVDLFMTHHDEKMTVDDVYISFLPLAHIIDRMVEEFFFYKGASVGYYHGDINALSNDLMELKPTFFAGVPRVFERIYEGAMKSLQQLSPVKRTIFHLLYKYKLAWMNAGFKQRQASWLADSLAFHKVKERLGGRVRLILSGGAPLSTEIDEFLRVTSCSLFVQGYGLTETCGQAAVGFADEMSMLGTTGVAALFTELCLKEVPDMGYNPLDYPSCGEVCVKGKTIFSGYYKNPEMTREAFKDGWFHTGDIGELQSNGTLKIIDRKKNIFKLSQGEYVAVEYLEKLYLQTPIVDDIWVYGNSFKSALVAVVVPDEANTKKWADSNGYTSSFSELCSLDGLRNHILHELRVRSQKNKMRGFEYIKGVILDPLPFDAERDLITPTLKKKRSQLLKYYQEKIDAVYRSLS